MPFCCSEFTSPRAVLLAPGAAALVILENRQDTGEAAATHGVRPMSAEILRPAALLAILALALLLKRRLAKTATNLLLDLAIFPSISSSMLRPGCGGSIRSITQIPRSTRPPTAASIPFGYRCRGCLRPRSAYP